MTQFVYSASNAVKMLQNEMQHKRNELGISPKNVAQLCNVCDKTVKKWIYSPKSIKSFLLLQRMCVAHEISLEVILGTTEYRCNEYIIDYAENKTLFKQRVGKVMKEARESVRITRAGLASKATVDCGFIANIERGYLCVPRPETLHRLLILIGAKLIVRINM
jgi:DNA-binding XRE family transcriptional regulator